MTTKFYPPSERPYIFPTAERAEKANDLLERMTVGDVKAQLEFADAYEQRTAAAADIPFALANKVNAIVQADYGDDESDWLSNNELFSNHPMTDYDDEALMEFQNGVDDAGRSGRSEPRRNGTLPIVAELAPYTTFAYKKAEGRTVSLAKRGAMYSMSFEAGLKANRIMNFTDKVIQSMQDSVPRTWRTEYMDILKGLGADRHLKGGTVEGFDAPVVADAPFSEHAYREALTEISKRNVNGRRVAVQGNRFFLFCNYTTSLHVAYVQSQNIIQLVKGDPGTTTQLEFLDNSTRNLSRGLTVIVDDYLPDNFWALVPYKSAVPANREPITKATLIGYDTPDIRVADTAGNTIGGGRVDPTAGSFVNDSISYRIRAIGKFNLLNDDALLVSTGNGK